MNTEARLVEWLSLCPLHFFALKCAPKPDLFLNTVNILFKLFTIAPNKNVLFIFVSVLCYLNYLHLFILKKPKIMKALFEVYSLSF